MTKEQIVKKFRDKLPNSDFISPYDLVESEIFGSIASVHAAIKKGKLPCARISSNRTLIDKEGVLQYLADCCNTEAK